MNKTAAHRSIARRAVLEKVALDNVGSEIAGGLLTPVTTGLAGAGIGALTEALRGRDWRGGAGMGAAVGSAWGAPLANILGGLAGVIARRRTRKEQQEHDSKSHWENFIPGVAAYNMTKRKGRVLAGVGEPDEEKKAAEAAFAEGFCKTAASGGATLQKQAQRLKLLAGAERAADVRKALAAGKVILPSSAEGVRKTLAAGKAILPPAPSLKELILDRVAGLRGSRSLGWPLPAYPGRAGRAKGLLDYEDHLWSIGDWGRMMRDGKTPMLYEARLLRQLNGDRSAVGKQVADALHAARNKPKPVGIDLAPLVTKKKAEAAFAEGFCKAAETLGVDPGALAEHMAVKKADLTRKNALRWLLRLGGQSGTGRVRTRITEIGGRLRDVGRLSPQVDENLTQMGDIARRLEEYTAARGAAGGWIGKPDWVGSTLPKGKKLLPQLIEDAGPGLSSGLRDSARSVLKSVGYIK